MPEKTARPEILAPVGSKAAFAAALAAGADAVYCGLKQFSARMAAENFSTEELARLVSMAHDRGVSVYVTVNTLVKTGELDRMKGLVRLMTRHIKPDALIVQDLALISLARQEGFAGEIHLSTLSAVTFASGLKAAASLPGVNRVVLPREFNIDEIRQAAADCPASLSLELFVHGALCYGVSGRCYWSSYMGGKSGLRGRCVQPCRRRYAAGNTDSRFFSCLDFSADVLVKPLLEIPAISAWKIEGRKKGPHYVYHTVTAYRMLRDRGREPDIKKTALVWLDDALGRKTTHYLFLPQRPYLPAGSGDETGSGLLLGRVRADGKGGFLKPRRALLKNDLLRIGYEDQPGHHVSRVGRHVPSGGRLHLKLPANMKDTRGNPVFLIDRVEPELESIIDDTRQALTASPEKPRPVPEAKVDLPRTVVPRRSPQSLYVYRQAPPGGVDRQSARGLWLPSQKADERLEKNVSKEDWLWLPPVVWQEDEATLRRLIARVVERRARRFVLNAPWQTALFPEGRSLELWAGPFCNVTNPLAVAVLAEMGFAGVIVSPELSAEDFPALPRHSVLPLGIVVAGNWPLCLARTRPADFPENRLFSSPHGEASWLSRRDACFWVFPNWPLDIIDKQPLLQKSGYQLFVHLVEPLPRGVIMKKRPGLWNWTTDLA